MKNKNKCLIIVTVALLTMAFLLPVYAQSQNGILQRDRDQECAPQGPATRSYGEDTQNPEGDPSAVEETPEQTHTAEQLRECDCENEDCEEYQYQYQHQFQHGQEQD